MEHVYVIAFADGHHNGHNLGYGHVKMFSGFDQIKEHAERLHLFEANQEYGTLIIGQQLSKVQLGSNRVIRLSEEEK